MATKIPATSYFGGDYYRPDGRDDGNDFSALITTFMERMAIHDHSGGNSRHISLAPSKVDITLSSATVADTVGWKTPIILVNGTLLYSASEFFYKLKTVPDEPQNWVRFCPEYDQDAANEKKLTLRRIMFNDIDFKVVT